MSWAGVAAWAVAAVLLIGPARAATQFGYGVGSGASTSYLVVDFGFVGGGAFEFAYSYDGSATGQDMLLALDDGGPLEVSRQFFDFGGGPSLFVDGFSFAGYSEVPGFEGSAGENWSYWTSESAPTLASAWGGASFGPTDRLLSNGSYDGFALNVSVFNSGGFTPTNNPPAAVPEPAGVLTLLGLGSVFLTRRRLPDNR